MPNSRAKGARGEREFAKQLRDVLGVTHARRGVQYAGGPDSPDVIGLDGVHFEVKRVEQINLYKFMEQAVADAGPGQVPVVVIRKNREDWILAVQFSRLEDLAEVVMTHKFSREDAEKATREALRTAPNAATPGPGD